MICDFTIEGRLVSLNDVINCARTHKYKSAKLKKEQTEYVTWHCPKIRLSSPVYAVIVFYEVDKRRDVDNISSSAKFIFDGLVSKGVLPNDNQKYLKQYLPIIQHGEPHIHVFLYAHFSDALKKCGEFV